MLTSLTPYLQKITKNERLPVIIILLLVLLMIYHIWQAVEMVQGNNIEINSSPIHRAIVPSVDISQLHLLGRYDANLADLPQTQLQLGLQGIAMGVGNNGESRVLISAASQPTEVYKIGDTVPGGAIVRQILRDRVILDDKGHYETLNLPVPQIAGTIARVH